jgi:hypothetical protein
MPQSLHSKEVGLDARQVLVLEIEVLHCEVLPRQSPSALAHDPMSTFSQFFQNLIFLLKKLGTYRRALVFLAPRGVVVGAKLARWILVDETAILLEERAAMHGPSDAIHVGLPLVEGSHREGLTLGCRSCLHYSIHY